MSHDVLDLSSSTPTAAGAEIRPRICLHSMHGPRTLINKNRQQWLHQVEGVGGGVEVLSLKVVMHLFKVLL